jgi:hypothetical protein
MKKLKIKKWTSCIEDRNKWKLNDEVPKHSKNEVVAPKEEEEHSYIFRSPGEYHQGN